VSKGCGVVVWGGEGGDWNAGGYAVFVAVGWDGGVGLHVAIEFIEVSVASSHTGFSSSWS